VQPVNTDAIVIMTQRKSVASFVIFPGFIV
jgi:hypothetical protein